MKSFYTLLVSQWFANIGDVLYIVALIALLYDQTGSALLAASFPVAVTAGMTASGFVFARVVSILSLERTLLVSQGFKTCLLFVVWQFDPPFLLGIVCLIAFLDGFARPIQTAFIPRLATDLNRANSLVQGSNQFIQLAMWPLATALIVWTSSGFALGMTFVLFLISTCLLVYFVRTLPRSPKEEEALEEVSFRDSLRFVRNAPFSRELTRFVAYESFVSTLWISALLLVYLEERLHVSSGWWGTMNASYLISMVLASIILYRVSLGPSLRKSGWLSIGAALLFALTTHVAFALVALAIQGFATQLRIIQSNTLLQTNVATSQLPYVYSIQQMAYTCMFSVGSLTFGWLADLIPIALVYAVGALVTVPVARIGRRLDTMPKCEQAA